MATVPQPTVAAVPPTGPAISGQVRIGRRTKQLVKRLRPGEVAVIDHRNIDRVAGEELAAIGPVAVLNCRPSTSGEYPNMGPLLIARAGIPIVDCDGPELMDALSDGDVVEVRGGEVWSRGRRIAAGRLLDAATLQALNDEQRREIGAALEAFARNTVEHMIAERELLSGAVPLPHFDTDFRDRPVLVVVRGVDHKRDLRTLRPYIRDVKPVLVAVDGGADAIVEAGFRPHMIVGDMDSASEAVLRSGAELVVHAYEDGRAPGRELLESLGLPHIVLPAPGTSQDIAMLIASEKGAELIVTVGSQFNLVEFLDKNRRGMASTFITRLRVGEILVDAKGVSRLYRPRPPLAPLLALLFVGMLAFVAVVASSDALRDLADLLWLKAQVLLGLG